MSASRTESAETRWAKAQARELEFWQARKVLNHGRALWERKYQMFVAAPVLMGRVLEVGCGPTGAIGFLPGDFLRVGVDPLAAAYRDNGLIEADYALDLCSVRAEELPFKNDQFDIVLCLNTLDHVMDPAGVMREMARVTRPGGTILLWLHVVQPRWRFLKGVAGLVDRTHPQHMTLDDVHGLYAGACSIEGLRLERPIGAPTSLKARGGNLVLESAYLTLKVLYYQSSPPEVRSE